MGTFDKQASTRAAEAAWAASPVLRHEFMGDKEVFIAYRCAADAGRLKVFSGCGAAPAGVATAAGAPSTTPRPDAHAVRQLAEREWAESAAIRSEFGDQAAFLAYRCAEAAGQVRVFSNTVAAPAAAAPSAPATVGAAPPAAAAPAADPAVDDELFRRAKDRWLTSAEVREAFADDKLRFLREEMARLRAQGLQGSNIS